MTKTIYMLIFIVVFSSCESKKTNVENVNGASEKETINTTLDAWHKSASEAEFDSYFKSMAKASVFIGTDAAEYWVKKDFKVFSKPFFDRGEAWNFKSLERNVYISSDGKTAWFDELLDTWMGICRGSGVLSKKEDVWKIEHYVLSVTIPNENITDVIAIKKEKDSAIVAKLSK
ncbi:MAG: nuclear transport factor 2 family protein [Gelidibacter sp.]|nr:nuclear transport factor 2 family protein [Gelidibacter sp.]